MQFGKFKEKASELQQTAKEKAEDLQEKSSDLQNTAKKKAEQLKDKAEQLIVEFNEAIPTLKALGLTVRDFRIGMGILPEIQTRLDGSVKDLNEEKSRK